MQAYYDYVLLAIPLVMLSVPTTLVFSGLALTSAIPLAGLLACAIIGHALFVKGPTVADPVPPQAPSQ